MTYDMDSVKTYYAGLVQISSHSKSISAGKTPMILRFPIQLSSLFSTRIGGLYQGDRMHVLLLSKEIFYTKNL